MENVQTPNSLKAALANFFQKYRLILLGVLGGLLLALVVLAVVFEFQKMQAVNDQETVQKAIQTFEKAEAGEGDVEASLSELTNVAASVQGLSRFQALNTLVQHYVTKENWEKAYELALQLNTAAGGNFSTGAILWNTSVLAERVGQKEKALELIQQMANLNDANLNYLKPLALWTQARLELALDKKTEAKTTLQKLVDTYPDSEWTNPARSLILSQEPNP